MTTPVYELPLTTEHFNHMVAALGYHVSQDVNKMTLLAADARDMTPDATIPYMSDPDLGSRFYHIHYDSVIRNWTLTDEN